MRGLKCLAVVALLLLAACGPVAYGQKRRAASSRRARRPATGRVLMPPPFPCPPAAATTTASGLTYLVTERGAGQPLKAGDTVLVHYTGLLTDGTKFDSSRDRGEPFPFELGAGRVIRGWDEGVSKLRVGDRATFVIPPQLGYGARGAGGAIPPNATLIFIIEILGVRDAAPAGGTTAPGVN